MIHDVCVLYYLDASTRDFAAGVLVDLCLLGGEAEYHPLYFYVDFMQISHCKFMKYMCCALSSDNILTSWSNITYKPPFTSQQVSLPGLWQRCDCLYECEMFCLSGAYGWLDVLFQAYRCHLWDEFLFTLWTYLAGTVSDVSCQCGALLQSFLQSQSSQYVLKLACLPALLLFLSNTPGESEGDNEYLRSW